jgi:phage FluMu protein Com
MPKPELVEFRCPNDGRLLFKASAVDGQVVEIRCPRCKELHRAELQDDDA